MSGQKSRNLSNKKSFEHKIKSIFQRFQGTLNCLRPESGILNVFLKKQYVRMSIPIYQKYHRYMLLKYTPINSSITAFRLRLTFQNPKFCQHQNFRLIVLALNFNIIILQKSVSDSTEGVIFLRKTTFNLKIHDKNDTKNQPIRFQGTLSLPPENLTIF